jgi:hypothetical protein
MIYLPWLLCGVFLLLLLVSLFYNWKFANILLKLQDEIEDSLEILDVKYNSISKILDIPLFFDSPQVRAVLEDIKSSRDAILVVANNLAKIEEDKRGKDEKNS